MTVSTRYQLTMRLESFTVEEMTLMVDALLDFIRHNTPRGKGNSDLDRLTQSWCEIAAATAKKLWPILRAAETTPATGIALEGAPPPVDVPDDQRPPPETRVVLLTIDDLKFLERAIEAYAPQLNGRGGGRNRLLRNPRLANVGQRLLGRVSRMHARARRTTAMSIATP